jgi:hypothetical protein
MSPSCNLLDFTYDLEAAALAAAGPGHSAGDGPSAGSDWLAPFQGGSAFEVDAELAELAGRYNIAANGFARGFPARAFGGVGAIWHVPLDLCRHRHGGHGCGKTRLR